jgi:hypothetical protein
MRKKSKKIPFEKFDDWRKRIDSLRINGNGLGGIVFAERKYPTPDREECSSYVDFFYKVGTETCVRDVIYEDGEIKSRGLRNLAIDYLNSALKNYEAIPDSRVQSQFRLFPRVENIPQESPLERESFASVDSERLRYFLDQTGKELEDWGGMEGIEPYINPQ